MKVTAFFIKVGSVDLDILDNLDSEDKKKIREAAEQELAKLTNGELLEAMAMSYDCQPIEDLIFEDKPYIEAIELKNDNFTTIFQTKLWKTYKELDDIVTEE